MKHLTTMFALVAVALLATGTSFAEKKTETTDKPAAKKTDDKAKKKKAKKKKAKKKKSKASPDKPTKTTGKKYQGGKYWKIDTGTKGNIYVWIPNNYDRKTAGTVIYVHGYWTTVDKAWTDHELAKQFKKSRQNAMFIVPEAPSNNKQDVVWDALTDLKKTVRKAGIRLPDGETVAVAHSGGFRTVRMWHDYKWLTEIILLDAMYGGQKEFKNFIHDSKRAKHRKMVIVASDTKSNSKSFAKEFPYAVIRDDLPKKFSGFTKKQKKTRLLYIKSQYGHGALADGGVAMPLLLRLTPLKRM